MQGTLFYRNLVSSHFLCERNTDHKAIPRTKKHDFLCAGKEIRCTCNKVLLDGTYMKSIINQNNGILGLKDKKKITFQSNSPSKQSMFHFYQNLQ